MSVTRHPIGAQERRALRIVAEAMADGVVTPEQVIQDVARWRYADWTMQPEDQRGLVLDHPLALEYEVRRV